jgi:ssDNA-binding Zn-finger/Zn-ribbon topoisomerase 1
MGKWKPKKKFWELLKIFWEEKERKPIPMKVKRQVYKRAKGKCEKCRRPLKMNQGDFHHTRDPTVTPRAKTVRFFCPTCHRIYGHKRITRKRETFFGTEK